MYAGEGVGNRTCKRHGWVCEACGRGEPVRRRDVETDGQRNRLCLPTKRAEDSQHEAEGGDGLRKPHSRISACFGRDLEDRFSKHEVCSPYAQYATSELTDNVARCGPCCDRPFDKEGQRNGGISGEPLTLGQECLSRPRASLRLRASCIKADATETPRGVVAA